MIRKLNDFSLPRFRLQPPQRSLFHIGFTKQDYYVRIYVCMCICMLIPMWLVPKLIDWHVCKSGLTNLVNSSCQVTRTLSWASLSLFCVLTLKSLKGLLTKFHSKKRFKTLYANFSNEVQVELRLDTRQTFTEVRAILYSRFESIAEGRIGSLTCINTRFHCFCAIVNQGTYM